MPAEVKAGEVLAGGAALARIVEVLSHQGLVAYPTDTTYGLGVDATSRAAIEHLFEVKGRSRDMPVPLLISDLAMLDRITRDVSPAARTLIARFWPGPLTLVLQGAADLPPAVSGRTGKVGVRIPDHPVAVAIARACPFPITATSANKSGQQDACEPAEIDPDIRNALDLLVEGGRTPGPPPSTVIDMTTHPPRFLRHGRIPESAIEAALGIVSKA